MNETLQLSLIQMGLAYLLLIVVIVVVRIRGISREKDILLAALRMTLQLILVGYLLVWIFDVMNPWLTAGVIALMEAFAVRTVYRRVKSPLSPALKRIIAASIVLGTLACMLYFLLVVVRIRPWFDPRYFIPISGMLIGNSMTGISLGVNSLANGMRDRRDLVEGALMLGASPRIAAKSVIDNAFDSAILPSINSMLGMGIVFLPGMMTGQILSGNSPLLAIRYQIAIMLGIMGSVSATVALFVFFGYRSYFNRDAQLVLPDDPG